MEKHLKNNYRYERKYVFHKTMLPALMSELYSNGFSTLYPERKINNIYLDTHDFRSVQENIDGISDRIKHRIRWYGNCFNQSEKIYEQKIKSEFVGKKKINKLGQFKLSSFDDVNQILNKVDKSFFKTDLKPTLYNSYSRKYFAGFDKKIRITLDNSLFFYSPLTKNKFYENKIILEIKYDQDHLFLNEFKMQQNLTKYSKYVKGISQTTFYKSVYIS